MAYDAIQEWIKDLEKEFRDLYGPGGEYGDGGVTIDPDGRFGVNPQYEEGKVIVEAERIPWQGNPHKDQDGWGTEPAIPSKTNVKKPDDEDEDDEDYLNQLMMAALMKGGEKGKMGQLGGAAGGGISFGDPWTMQAPWEKDYRYLS